MMQSFHPEALEEYVGAVSIMPISVHDWPSLLLRPLNWDCKIYAFTPRHGKLSQKIFAVILSSDFHMASITALREIG